MDKKDVRILVVEDSITQAERLRYILESHGFAVQVAHSGSKALELLTRYRPTLVISDIVMPGMDGYELCDRIRADEELKDLPIMLLTTLSEPKDILRALECGADNFVAKPYDDDFMLSRLQYTIENFNLRHSKTTQLAEEVLFEGETYSITTERHRIVDLLLSTYESVVQNNRELIETQNVLRDLNLQLEILLEEKNRLYEETRELSLRDALTGLANRRMMDIILKRTFADAKRSGKPFAVLMADVDFFKRYNDTHGHAAGDEVLVNTGRILAGITRETDLAARYGGEEFIVILCDADLEGALIYAEKLRETIQAETDVTISIGVSRWKTGTSEMELLRNADTALYRAKQAGRNRVEVFS